MHDALAFIGGIVVAGCFLFACYVIIMALYRRWKGW